jgi:flagellar basal-body rod protein FlgG
MIRAMFSAATGMSAQELFVDTIANNLANVNTTGFKKSRVDFQDILYQKMRPAGAENVAGSTVPSGIEIGLGVKPVSIAKVFTQGQLIKTENQLDVAIEGDGFFQVLLPAGGTAYTRDGAIKLDANGTLVTADGLQFQPTLTVPNTTTQLTIGQDGTVTATDQDGTATNLGQLTLAKFLNPTGLSSLGKNLYQENVASGTATTGAPGSTGIGSLSQGFLELSNIQLVEELVNMILAERAYEVNSKVVTTSDNMLQTATRLKG